MPDKQARRPASQVPTESAAQLQEPDVFLLHVVPRRRSDSCLSCHGPSGEDLSKGYYEAGGSFLKLGLVEAFLVRAPMTRPFKLPEFA